MLSNIHWIFIKSHTHKHTHTHTHTRARTHVHTHIHTIYVYLWFSYATIFIFIFVQFNQKNMEFSQKCLPYWICHVEFLIVDVRIVISDLKNSRIFIFVQFKQKSRIWNRRKWNRNQRPQKPNYIHFCAIWIKKSKWVKKILIFLISTTES